MALNAAMARMAEAPGGMKATPMAEGGFEELALPVAVRKRMGVIAMKVFGQDQIVGRRPIEKLLTYALSLPVSLASLGMPKPEFIERNIALARAFTPMSGPERRRLTDSIAAERKVVPRHVLPGPSGRMTLAAGIGPPLRERQFGRCNRRGRRDARLARIGSRVGSQPGSNRDEVDGARLGGDGEEAALGSRRARPLGRVPPRLRGPLSGNWPSVNRGVDLGELQSRLLGAGVDEIADGRAGRRSSGWLETVEAGSETAS